MTTGRSDLIRTNISGKYDFPTKITTHVKPPDTSRSNCVVIFVSNRIGDPKILFLGNIRRDKIAACDSSVTLPPREGAGSAVERTWHVYDSQGPILALALR